MARERLSTLFFAVFGLSATSWGGIALMAQLERRYVERKQLLSPQAFADLVAIAWAVPGPVACNVAVQLGYALRGARGALLAGIASVLPFFLAMVALAAAYEHHALPAVLNPEVLPKLRLVLVCLIGVTLWRQAKSLLSGRTEQAVTVLACLLLWFNPAPVVLVSILLASFGFGWVTGPRTGAPLVLPKVSRAAQGALALCAAGLLAFVCVPVGAAVNLALETLRQAGASLTLFGGAFSAFPVLHALFVEGANGVPADTFNTAFALSALVPGPLLNVVPFLGLLHGGVTSALLASCAFFATPGVLAVVAHRWLSVLRQSARFEHALRLLRAATTAFLASAILRLAPQIPVTPLNAALALVCVTVLARTKLPVYWLYLGVAIVALIA